MLTSTLAPRPSRRRSAAFPSLLLTAVQHAPAVCCKPRSAHRPRPRPSRRRSAAFPSLLLTAVQHAPAVCGQPRRAYSPRPRPSRRRSAAFPSLLLTAVWHASAVCCQPRRAHRYFSGYLSSTPFGFNVCGILICVKSREEGVAASVQILPAVRVGPASDLRAASRSASRCIRQSSLAVELLQVLPAHRTFREYQISSLRVAV